MLHRLSNLIGTLLRGRAQRDPAHPDDNDTLPHLEHAAAEANELAQMPAPVFALIAPEHAADAAAPDEAHCLSATTVDAEPCAEPQTTPQDVWLESIDEYVYRARFQLTTPLAALLFHDKRHLSLGDPPPEVTPGNRHGQWQPELQEEVNVAPESRLVPSAVGPIAADGGNFLPFLIAVRQAIETDEPIAARIVNLHKVLQAEAHAAHLETLGGTEHIERLFFPYFASSVSGLGKGVVTALRDRGLCTPAQIANATDAELLAIKGIGPARLKAIRAACLAATEPGCAFVDAVERPTQIHPYQ